MGAPQNPQQPAGAVIPTREVRPVGPTLAVVTNLASAPFPVHLELEGKPCGFMTGREALAMSKALAQAAALAMAIIVRPGT